MSSYPTRSEIEHFASSLETSDPSPFFDRVSENVVWDVMGTHPAAGHFTSLRKRVACIVVDLANKRKGAWKEGALGVANKFLSESLKLKVVNVIGGGDQEWAVLELEANATCKNGRSDPSCPCLEQVERSLT